MKTVARAGLLLLSWSATAYGQSAPPPTALSAALQAQATLCTSTDGSVTKDQIISACTALLGAKELNATERATSLLFRGTARSTGDPAAARKDFEAGLAIADADKSIRANLLAHGVSCAKRPRTRSARGPITKPRWRSIRRSRSRSGAAGSI